MNPREALVPLVDPPKLLFRETGQSYLGRLTGYYSCVSMREFCRDFGLDLSGIQRGLPTALRDLAELTASDINELLRWTPERVSEKVHRLGAVEFDVRTGPRLEIRECPKCAAEHIDANPHLPPGLAVYSRAEWVVGYIDTCDAHNVLLLRFRDNPKEIERTDPSYIRAMALDEIQRSNVVAARPNSFEGYALAKIRGEEAGPVDLLDQISLRHAVKLCTHLGRDLAGTQAGEASDLRAFRQLGFEALEQGYKGLEEIFLSMCRKLTVSDRANSVVPSTLYFLSSDISSELSIFRKIISSIFFKILPYEKGDILLGEICIERNMHTFYSAHQSYDVPRWLLRRFVQYTPGLATRYNARFNDAVIRKDIADTLFANRAPFLSGWKVCKMHGYNSIHKPEYINAALASGIISRLPDLAMSSGPYLTTLKQANDEIEAFSTRFRKISVDDFRLSTIPNASCKFKLSGIEILKFVGSGQLKNVFLVEGLPLYKSIRIDCHELLSLLTGIVSPMTIGELRDVLGIHQSSVAMLLDRKYITTYRPLFKEITGNMCDVTSAEEVEKFKSKYVLLHRTKGPRRFRTIGHLRAAGVHPAISLEGKGISPVYYISRSDLDR